MPAAADRAGGHFYDWGVYETTTVMPGVRTMEHARTEHANETLRVGAMRQTRRVFFATAMAISLLWDVGCVDQSLIGRAEIIVGLSRLILHPQETCTELRQRYGLTYLPLADNPAEAGMAYEEVWVPVTPDAMLHTWYLPAKLDRGTVVLSCGNAGPMACYLFTADLLTRHGWTVVMYEYEGFGESAGRASLDALYRDLLSAVSFARTATGREQVTLMGISLGSIPSVAVAVEHPELVNAVILDSPIALAAQIQRYGFIFGGQVDWIISQLLPELLPDSLIRFMPQPLLVFLHELDPIATPETVEWLYDHAAGPKRLVRFSGLGHAGGQFFDTDLYVSALEQFLADVWSQEAPSAEASPAYQP